MKTLKVISICLFSLILLGAFTRTSRGNADFGRLWTTDATGSAEKDQFSPGDAVYLKSADDTDVSGLAHNGYPTNYTIYVFAGNLFTSTEIVDGKAIASLTPVTTPVNVTTNANGKFGPILIWNQATYGNFTVVLDKIGYYQNGVFHGVNGWGTWQNNNDFRDDLCAAIPTPASFFVIPEAGTVLLLASMFGAFGCLALIKRRNG